MIARVVVVPARGPVVLHVVEHLAEVAEADRRAVAIGDDHLAESRRVLQLAVRLDRVRRVGPQRTPVGRFTFCAVIARSRPRRCRSCGRRARVGSSWMRTAYFCAPNTLTCATPDDHRDALRHHRLAVLVELRQRHQRRAERVVQDRLVRRVHLLVRRRNDARRQVAQRLGDLRLHVLRGAVDVALERELDRDRRRPEAARRRHVVDARDRRELLLERRRDRRRHRLRARARQARVHRERRDSPRSAGRSPAAGSTRRCRTRRRRP